MNRLLPQAQPLSGNGMLDFYSYDWLALRGAGFENHVDDYCLGGDAGISSCKFPVTEQAGEISLRFAPEILTRIGLEAFDAPQSLSFVITGDDDPKLDCYHQRLDMDVRMTYYIAN
jgi:hypothetical protein